MIKSNEYKKWFTNSNDKCSISSSELYIYEVDAQGARKKNAQGNYIKVPIVNDPTYAHITLASNGDIQIDL